MKSLTFLLAITLFTTSAAQVQVGLVREINSGKKPVGSVQVSFEGAVPTISDDNGIFRLAFSDKKPGDFIFLNEIRKAGYELVNGKDLEVLKISNSNRLGEDIIVAKKGVIDAAKKEYYEVSDRALLASFNKEKKALQNKLLKTELNKKEYEQQLTNLQEQFDKQQKNLEELAERFARGNFDDMDSLYRTALGLFKSGDIDGAIKQLEEADLLKRADDIIAAQINVEQTKKKGIRSLQLQVDLYLVKFRFKDAELLFDKLLQLDSTDINILQSSADFYKSQHRYAKALRLYPKITAHPNVQPWQQTNAYSSIGDIYIATGNLSEALKFATMLFQHCDELSKKNSASLFYKHNLGQALSMLGQIHITLGNLQQAMQLYRQFQLIEKQLYSINPDNILYKNSLAIAYLKLGEVETILGNLKAAMVQYEEALHLQAALSTAYPANTDFKHHLAVAYLRLGETAVSLGNLQQALLHYQKFYRLEKELHYQYPDNTTFTNSLGTACFTLGQTLATVGNLQQALEYYLQYYGLENEIQALYPDDVNFKSSLAQACAKLGETYTALGNLQQGKEYYEQYHRLANQLSTDYPTNIEYKSSLATACLRLGEVTSIFGDLAKASSYFEEYYVIEKSIHAQYPNIVRHQNELAIASSEVGKIRLKLGNLQEALLYFKEFFQLTKELCETYPDEINFRANLPLAYGHLGEIYAALGDMRLAIGYSQEYLKLSIEIYTKYSDNTIHQRNLASAYEQLGLLQQAMGEQTKTLLSLRLGNNLREALYNKFPDKLYNQELAVSTKRLGLMHLFAGNTDSANYYIEKSRSLFEGYYSGLAKDFQISYVLGREYQQYAHFCDSLKNLDGAIHFLLKGISFFKQGRANAPDSADWLTQISNSYGSIAYSCLYLKKFLEAEQYTLQGLATDSTQTWIYTNLALAYLYQGKWEQAKAIYLRLKNQPIDNITFKAIFLQDLKDLEAAGITHSDVARARILLQKPND